MAAVYDFKVDQGSTHTFQIKYTTSAGVPKSLVGFTIKGQVRRNINDCEAIGNLSCEVINEDEGTIKITVPHTFFTNVEMNCSSNKSFASFIYDIELHSTLDTSMVVRLLQGSIKVSPEVTKV